MVESRSQLSPGKAVKVRVAGGRVSKRKAAGSVGSRRRTSGRRKEDFKISEEVGVGGFSVVYLAKDLTPSARHAQVVLKIMDHQKPGSNFTPEDAFIEYKIQRKLRHVNIARVFGYWGSPLESTLVLEYCNTGDLHDYIHGVERSFPKVPFRNQAYVRQLVSALEYLQRREKVIHMDVKPENILITSTDTIKLSDFGCCYQMASPRTVYSKTNGGTRMYYPSELLRKQNPQFDSTADVWAIGCVAYELLADGHPFFPQGLEGGPVADRTQLQPGLAAMENMRRGTFREQSYLSLPVNVQVFLRQTIGSEREQRPLVGKLLQANWLSQRYWTYNTPTKVNRA